MARKLKDVPKSLISFKELRDKASKYIDLIESKGTGVSSVDDELVSFYFKELNKLFGLAKTSKNADFTPEDELKLKVLLSFEEKEVNALKVMLKKITSPQPQLEKAPVKPDVKVSSEELEFFKQMNERQQDRISDLENRLVQMTRVVQATPEEKVHLDAPVPVKRASKIKAVEKVEVVEVPPENSKRMTRPANYKPPTVGEMAARAYADADRMQQRISGAGIQTGAQMPVDKMDIKI